MSLDWDKESLMDGNRTQNLLHTWRVVKILYNTCNCYFLSNEFTKNDGELFCFVIFFQRTKQKE